MLILIQSNMIIKITYLLIYWQSLFIVLSFCISSHRTCHLFDFYAIMLYKCAYLSIYRQSL